MSQNNILVTGANGLLGREILTRLNGVHNLHAVVKCPPSDLIPGVNYHTIDLGSDWDVSLLPNKIDTIFHFAQSSKFRNFPDQALDVFNVNVDSTAKLLDYAQKNNVKRFLYSSSGGVYGAGIHEFHENSPIIEHGQLGYYLASKLCSEVLVQNYAQFMTVSILRFFFMYGPNQKRSMLIPRLLDNVKEGRPITIQGDAGISINPIHVKDAANAVIKTLELEQSITLNIAGPEILTIRKIAEMGGEMLGRQPIFEYQDAHVNNYIANIDSMRSLLVSPRITLRESLQEMLDI